MKEKIKLQKGIIQVPLLIGIIVAGVILSVMIGYKMIFLSNINTQPTTTITIAKTDWACGDSVTFTYRGELVAYGTVESQSRCWLDRNLGASKVATASDDSEAYGDLFQWGRGDDGHQDRDRTKEYTTNLSDTDNPVHNKFISTIDDWRLPQNDNLWQGVSGINNPCPGGWRLPTSNEWETERLSWSSNNGAGAFASPLKLTAAGVRSWGDETMINASFIGAYWSSTVMVQEFDYSILSFSFSLSFREYSVLPSELLVHVNENMITDNALVGVSNRANGYSVRCIKD